MRISKAIVVLFVVSFVSYSPSQTKFTVSGYVRDAKSGEELIGANLIVSELPGTGTTTNMYGFYSLTIPAGQYTMTVQFLGYEKQSEKIVLTQNVRIDFNLTDDVITLDEIVVTGRPSNNTTQVQMGVEKLAVQEIQKVPMLFGEKDLLKSIQLLPGIKSSGEASSGLFVRGGGADQNLILLDEAAVYNASHLLGFFSVFNSDAIKDVTIHKGAQPPEYGGRLSSVLDIRMKDGNDKEFGVNGGIGLIASRLSIEGPIVKEQGSFIISGRRTYADLFLKAFGDSSLKQAKLYFYDLNAKANYRFDENNRIFLSGYFGKDVLGFGDTFGIDWGNVTGTLRWNYLFSEKLFSNTSLIFSNYDYSITGGFGGNALNIFSKIETFNFKEDIQYFADPDNEAKFGIHSAYYTIAPGVVTVESPSQASKLRLTNRLAWENSMYASHSTKFPGRLRVEYGLRLTTFSVLGPGDFSSYTANGTPTDTVSYGAGDFVTTYLNVEPRISMNLVLDERSSVKASYGRSTQNLHLLSNSTADNPTDRWIPSSNTIKPGISDQISLGYFANFKENAYEFSVETYYKSLQNQIDYRDGADLMLNGDVESQLLFGSGRAFGLELLLKKKIGQLTGWIGYTLSRSEKKFDEINNGNPFPARQDRTHDLSIVGAYQLTEKWALSAAWVYSTGNAVTFPGGKYEIAGNVLNYYTERNGYRMPPYHRLDLGATWQGENSSWTFSLYNAYAQDNAYTITFQKSESDPTRTEAVQTSLFKIVPSITYNFRF